MFVDTVKVQARAGKGGNGCIAFSHEPFKPKGGPCGGDGGKGGDVILQADHDINNLIAQYYSPHLHAKDGRPGEGKGKTNGRAMFLRSHSSIRRGLRHFGSDDQHGRWFARFDDNSDTFAMPTEDPRCPKHEHVRWRLTFCFLELYLVTRIQMSLLKCKCKWSRG